MRAIRSYFIWLVQVLGVVLLLLSTVFRRFGSELIPFGSETLQVIGLILFVAGLLIQTFAYQMQMNRDRAASAALKLVGARTIRKEVYEL